MRKKRTKIFDFGGMNVIMKKILKLFIPPILLKIYRLVVRGRFYGIAGNYSGWAEAEKHLKDIGYEGYSKPEIVSQVLESIQAVRCGKATFERDGVLFNKSEYNYPLLAVLFRVMLHCKQKNENINVLDFGGSLGSTFFQNKEYLRDLMPFEWHICEQPHFIEIGQREIPEIKFHKDIRSYLGEGYSCDILLLSGVLQYFDDPMKWLADLLSYSFRYIVFDRTFFYSKDHNRLGIQYIQPTIYDACYPAWLLSQRKVYNLMEKEGYSLMDEWESIDRINVKSNWFSHEIIPSKGALFMKSI